MSPDTDKVQAKRAILIEDETLVVMLLEDILERLGCEIVGSAANIDAGLRLATECEADLAILDVNVQGQPIFPVAERLVERGVPIVFSTGYGHHGLPPEWRSFDVVTKPFTEHALAEAINNALGNGR